MMSTRTKLSILSFLTAFLTGCILFFPYIKYGLSKFLAHDYPMFFLITSANITLLGLLIWFLGKAFLFGLLCIYEILIIIIDNTTFFYRYIKVFVIEKTKAMSTLEKTVNFTLLFSALGLIQKLTALDINETTSLGQTIYAWLFVPINLTGIYIGIRYILPLLLRLMFIGSEKVILESPDSAENLWLKANKVMKKNISNKKIEKTRFKLKTVDGEKVNNHINKL